MYQQGLSQEEVQKRIQNHQVNIQPNTISKSYKNIFKDHVFTVFNLVNFILAFIILTTGSYKNLLFMGVVLSNLFIGIIQEIRAKKMLDQLSLIHQAHVDVIRDGKTTNIPIEQIVLDDIFILKSGAQICCDAKIIEGHIEVNESMLTGESDILLKKEDDLLYSGSYVCSGSAIVKAIHVGDENYASKIIQNVKRYRKHPSLLRDSLNLIIFTCTLGLIPMSILLFLKQFFFSDMTLNSIILSTCAALIGMIPEGLILLSSLALTIGSIHLAKKNTLVQELYSIESLARIDTICLDKTGTITKGEMQVDSIQVLTKHPYEIKDILGSIMKETQDQNASALAISSYCQNHSLNINATHVIPFSSDRKYCAITYTHGSYILGAYDFYHPIPDAKIISLIKPYMQQGARVLTLSFTNNMQDIKNSIPLALIILKDPIRKEAKQILNYFKEHQVKVKIISGDDVETISSIAQKIDFSMDALDASKYDHVNEFAEDYDIFGRVSPTQKKELIQTLKQNGHVVAMVGDGVNDVMALKESDCSISLGHGSDAAKQISNLVLLDNDFSHMPQIVNEGRRILNNIQRAASLFLVKTIFSILISFLTITILPKYPFAPIQLTLVSSLTIGIPAFFLALEPDFSPIKKDFIFNIFASALPGGLCVVCSCIYTFICAAIFDFNFETISTMCLFACLTNGFIVLYKVCIPFSFKRFLIFISMVLIAIFAILFFHEIFYIQWLSMSALIMLIINIALLPFMHSGITLLSNKLNLRQRFYRKIKKSTIK